MFQSEPVLWLQGFATEWLTAFMVLVSELGHSKLYVALVLVVLFGMSRRAGIILLQIVLWNAVLSGVAKDLFELPRPAEVDTSVQLLAETEPNDALFTGADADAFWGLPQPQAVEQFRSERDTTFGFPSGHVSSAAAFWTGAAVLLASRGAAFAGALFVALTAMSRMYLGRHFLADVLGGLALGVLVAWAGYWLLVRRYPGVLDTLARRAPAGAYIALAAALVGVPLLLLLTAPTDATPFGRVLGANLALLFLVRLRVPDDAGDLRHRVARVAVAWAVYAIAMGTVEGFVTAAGGADTGVGDFIDGALPPPLYLLGATAIACKLRLFPEPAPRTEPGEPMGDTAGYAPQ
jgi:membrane-associated phospholipid phosphatase